VKDVEQFLGLLQDVNVDVGVMVCPEGYSQAAINRAHYDDSRLELDILNFKELKFFQRFGAIPYAGDVGVLMPAPFGWVIDARKSPACTACLYQRGVRLEEAMDASEWMYVKFSMKDEKVPDLEALLQIQETYMRHGTWEARRRNRFSWLSSPGRWSKDAYKVFQDCLVPSLPSTLDLSILRSSFSSVSCSPP
jgi:hypothetical protein